MQHNGQLVGNSTALVRTEPAQPLVPVKNERKSVDADSVLVASLRLTLRVTDAILLSNMPSGIVKEAVKNGELKSIGTGRNRRIKRSALDAWLETLG
jgi:excisionase family DNA binding protein